MSRRHTPEQVIAKLRLEQKMLNDGRPLVEVIKEVQVTEGNLVPLAEPVRVRESRRGVQTDQGTGEGERPAQARAGGEGTGHRHPQRGGQRKILSPGPRAVPCAWRWKSSGRPNASPALLGQNRSAFRKKEPDMGFEDMQLRAALRAVAVNHPRGWRKARWDLLAQPEWDGVALNRKRIRRLWRDEGLICKPKARKKRRTEPGAGDQKGRTAEFRCT
jgi:hypothetical protein